MQNYSENQVQSKGNWRAIQYDWDVLGTYSQSNYKLYCLSDFQANWLLSNVVYLSWMPRQVNYSGTQDDLNSLAGELEYRLMSCMDIQSYQIQALYDNVIDGLLQTYLDSWDGSLPSSVNPSAPDDYFDGDGSTDRQQALCTAMALWCYSYAVDWSQKASAILGVSKVATFLLSIIAPVGGNIATEIFAQLTSPLETTLDAINNQDALDTVICDWKTALDTLSITPSHWSDAVATLSYDPLSDEYAIQQLFVSDSQLLNNFLSFVNALGQAYDLAQINIYICPCEEIWEYTIDFTVFNGFLQGWAVDTWGDGWVLGQGWQSQDAPTARENNYLRCTFPFPTQVTYFDFTYASTAYTNFPGGTTGYLSGAWGDTSYHETYRIVANGQLINATRVQYDSSVPVLADWIRCANNPTFPSGKWYIVAATVRGIGANPFV